MTSTVRSSLGEHRAAVARRLVVRSIHGVVRAVSPLTALAPASRPRSPVFVIGCPRSGTTLLFESLRRVPGFASVPGEGQVLWDAFHHPRRHGWESNALRGEDVGDRERSYVYLATTAVARRNRFLDKTPKNCLRIPYLIELFPDASFVFLRRRAADNINSLIQGWRAYPRYVTYRLPEALAGVPGSRRAWSFALVPGWRRLRQASLAEICAHQYGACNEALLEAERTVESASVDVFYEDFVTSPRRELERILTRLGMAYHASLGEMVERLCARPFNAVTDPAPAKWKVENPREIERVLPLVRETERCLGYTDPTVPTTL